jgi:hypothetical protein
MLVSGGYPYDTLPSLTSIRVILLAPGQSESDVFSFLYLCNLEKDCIVDPCLP